MESEKVTKFTEILEELDTTRIYVFLHDFPDPDALGSAVGIQKIIKEKFQQQIIVFGSGLSHPQNRTLVNALNLELINPFSFFESKEDTSIKTLIDSSLTIWLDMNPLSTNFKFGRRYKFNPQWSIDHHIDKERSPENDLVHLEAVGATCTLITEYIQALNLKWDEENEEDGKIAAAMMLGIMTDTGNLKTATTRDVAAFEYLKNFYNQDTYNSIENYELNSYFFDVLHTAYNNREQIGSLMVLNLGFLSESRRDAIPFIADLWKKNKDISVVIAFGIINNSITASVRVKSLSSLTATELARGVFITANSGGHSYMSGAVVPFNEFFDLSLLDETRKNEFLHTIMSMIVKRAKKLTDLDT